MLDRLLRVLMPWYDPDEAARRERELDRRIAVGRRVRAKAVHVIHADPHARAVDGYRAYGERMGHE